VGSGSGTGSNQSVLAVLNPVYKFLLTDDSPRATIPLVHIMTRAASTKQQQRTTNLGRVLKSWRMIKDLSLRDAGARIGVSYSTLLRIEMGHEPDFGTMLRILCWMAESETVETGAVS